MGLNLILHLEGNCMNDEIKIKTLTPLWTGDIDGKCNKIKETGIIGSLRWWYEALVRGLGGYACDITSNNSLEKCDYFRDKDRICDACRLFGCTGWSRRFRIETEYDKNGFNKSGYNSKQELRIKLIELFPLSDEQKWLFKNTLFLIENYGAIGGRTPKKPQESKTLGMDYGLTQIIDYGKIEKWDTYITKKDVENYLKKRKNAIGKNNVKDLFNFKNYWIIDDCFLNRIQINQLVGRDDDGNYTENADKWLGGNIGESKKIFSFKTQRKVFGYVRDENELEKLKSKLIKIIGREKIDFKTGKKILGDLK